MLYKERLKEELERRKSKNPRYSLSAFARDIGLTPAALSLVFSGQRHFSRRTLAVVAKILKWEEEDLSAALDEMNRRPRRVVGRKPQGEFPVREFHLPSMTADGLDALERYVNSLQKADATSGPIFKVIIQAYRASIQS